MMSIREISRLGLEATGLHCSPDGWVNICKQRSKQKTPTDLHLGDQWGPSRANLVGDLTSREKRK